MSPRTLLRYDQIRRIERVDSPADDSQFAKGRYFRANCQPADALNNCVRITGITLGTPDVTTVDVFDKTKMPAVGIIVEKTTTTDCLVQVVGLVETLSGVIIGKRYFIDGAGFPTASMPTPSLGGIACVQTLGVGYDSDILLLEPNYNLMIRTG